MPGIFRITLKFVPRSLFGSFGLRAEGKLFVEVDELVNQSEGLSFQRTASWGEIPVQRRNPVGHVHCLLDSDAAIKEEIPRFLQAAKQEEEREQKSNRAKDEKNTQERKKERKKEIYQLVLDVLSFLHFVAGL